MATLYQLHCPMDQLKHGVDQMAKLWQRGDSILLLGSCACYIDWLSAYLADAPITDVTAIYALKEDIDHLADSAVGHLDSFTQVLSDTDWVNLSQNAQFDKVITIAL